MSTNSRRTFFSRLGDGMFGAALAHLFETDLILGRPKQAPAVRTPDLTPKANHFEPKATSVIHLFMNGGPSQVDPFDPKPLLKKYEGQPPSRELTNDVEQIGGLGTLMPPPTASPGTGRRGWRCPNCCPI